VKSQQSKLNEDNDVKMSKAIWEENQVIQPYVTVESPVGNNGILSNDKLNSCPLNSLEMLVQDFVSNDKDLKPFWNEQCQELTSHLWLPTETDLRDSDLASLNTLSKEMVANSWFSTKLFSHQNKNLPKTCSISSTFIKESGIYPRVSGKGLRYSESLPESFLDSRLVWKAGKYYLSVPFKTLRVPYGDNQARVVAIDSGIRSFATFYSDDTCGFIGKGDFSRIQRLAQHLDNLVSRLSKTPKQKKRKMRLAAARMRENVKNLIDELHHKSALFLVKNFDLILLPTFETKQMTGKVGRKIRNKTVRSLLTFAHYRFKQFIKHKAFEFGKFVVDVNEAYTSKTHPETGEIKNIGGAKYSKLLSGERVNRDLVGTRNILL